MGETVSGPARRARWAAALLARESAKKIPLDDRRVSTAAELAVVKARLAESDEGALGLMVQRVKEEKATAAVAGMKRAAECSRQRKALRARAQNALNERASVAVHSPRDAAARRASPHKSRELTNPAESSPSAEELSPCSNLSRVSQADARTMDGWHRVEARSGRCYFVNGLTQQSQWEVPAQSAASSLLDVGTGNGSQPSLAALRWHHAIEALILAGRHHRIIAQLKSSHE
jgi:hypothetical protein